MYDIMYNRKVIASASNHERAKELVKAYRIIYKSKNIFLHHRAGTNNEIN